MVYLCTKIQVPSHLRQLYIVIKKSNCEYHICHLTKSFKIFQLQIQIFLKCPTSSKKKKIRSTDNWRLDLFHYISLQKHFSFEPSLVFPLCDTSIAYPLTFSTFRFNRNKCQDEELVLIFTVQSNSDCKNSKICHIFSK